MTTYIKWPKGLLEYETLSAEDINNILSGKVVSRVNTETKNVTIDPENNQAINNGDIKNPTPNET